MSQQHSVSRPVRFEYLNFVIKFSCFLLLFFGVMPPVWASVEGTTVLDPSNLIRDLSIDDYNRPLYDCLIQSHSESTPLGAVATVICPDAGIARLDGLEGFDSLQVLDLHNPPASALPNTFKNLNPLIDAAGAPVSSLLATIDLSGLDLSVNSPLFNSLDNYLPQFTELRDLNLSAANLSQLPRFADVSGVGLSLQRLVLDENQLGDLDGLADLNAVNELSLNDNPLGASVLSSGSVLSTFPEMISLSLDGAGSGAGSGLRGEIEAGGLPGVVGFLSLRNHPGLVSFRLPEDAAQQIVFSLDLSQNPSLSCAGLDTLDTWLADQTDRSTCVGDLSLSQECFLAPFASAAIRGPEACRPEAPANFEVELMPNRQSYRASWTPVPMQWAVDAYRLSYREGLSGTVQTIELNDADATGHGFELPQLTAGEHYQFAIESCHVLADSSLDCGLISAYREAAYPLFAPEQLMVTDYGDGSVGLSWAYPDLPASALLPMEFRVGALFPVVDPLPAPIAFAADEAGVWSTTIDDIDAYPARIVRVRACGDDGGASVCGPFAEVTALGGPAGTVEIAPPAHASLNVMGAPSAGEFMLSWPAGGDEVDYYQIEEMANGLATGRRYAIEETQLAIKRYDHTLENGIQFQIKACRRDRDNGDQCSLSAAQSASLPVQTNYQIGSPIDVCWFDASVSGNTGSVSLKWGYDAAAFDAPQRFEFERIDGAILPIIEIGGTIGFSDAEYDPLSQSWYWTTDVNIYAGPFGISEYQVASRYGQQSASDAQSRISPLILDDQDLAVLDLDRQCANPPATTTQEVLPGGPGDLQPGHFSDDPAHRGQGWRFYWANELRAEDLFGDDPAGDDLHQAFGISYDLIGFWYSYQLIDGQWSPVWYFTRMQLVENAGGADQYFEGALIYPRGNAQPDQQVGTVRLYFEHPGISPVPVPGGGISDPNQNAWIEVQINQGNGLAGVLSHQIHDIALDHPSIQNQALNPHDHYSGVWTVDDLFTAGDALNNQDFFLVDWIERELHSMGLNLFDDQGRPIWIANLHCADGTGADQSSCAVDASRYDVWRGDDDFFTVYPGNHPLAAVPDSWGEVADHRVSVAGYGGRQYQIQNNGPRDPKFGEVCFDFDSIQIGSRTANLNQGSNCTSSNRSLVNVKKTANLHHIDYQIGGDTQATTCELNASNPACVIDLTWFTDGDYPDTYPYFIRDGNPAEPLSHLCPGGTNGNGTGIDDDYVVAAYACAIEAPGSYQFLLQNRASATVFGETIARSRGFTISGTSPNMGGVAPVADTVVDAASAQTLALNPAHDPTIGAVSGQAGVSGGAATYQIPIQLPPGRRGMQPEVQLSYHSRAGNGPLGMGWSLAVGSSLHRCPQTLAQDGQTLGVRYRETDRLCLDGQRLMRVSAGDYWADGGVYRTEIDRFVQVRLIGPNAGVDGSAVRFEVRGKDHQVRHYGASSVSRVQPSGSNSVVSAWLLTQELDPYGNRVDYHYGVYGAGEHRIERIAYTGDATGEGNRQLLFDYADRCVDTECDVNESWQAGYLSEQTVRLDRVRTCIDTQCADGQSGLVRDYRLDYQLSAGSGRLLLSSIQECAWQSNIQHCLTPTEFNWGDQSAAFVWSPWQIDRGSGLENIVDRDPMVYSSTAIGPQFSPAGDFDGDGTREFQLSDGETRYLISLDGEGRERWRVGDVPTGRSVSSKETTATLISNFVNPAEMNAEVEKRLAALDPEQLTEKGAQTALEDQIIAEVTEEFILRPLSANAYSDLDNDGRVDFYGAVEDATNPGQYVLAYGHWRGLGQGTATTADLFELKLTDLPLTVIEGERPFVVETPVWGDVTGDGLIDALLYTSVSQPACDGSGTLEEVAAIELWVNQGPSGLPGDPIDRFSDQGIIYSWPCAAFDPDGDDDPSDDFIVREVGSRPSLQDINGDGVLDIAIASRIPDLFFSEFPFSDVTVENVVIPTGYQSAIHRYLLADVDASGVSFIETDLTALGRASDPRLTYHLNLDVNGDGHQDVLFVAPRDDQDALDNGDWYLQLFDGVQYRPAQKLVVPAELSIALQPHPRGLNLDIPSNILVTPQYAPLIKTLDWNSDGRDDLLVPRRLDQAICLIRKESIPNGTNTNEIFATYCPGSMDGSVAEPGYSDILNADAVPPDHRVGGIHFMGFGSRDRSTYEMGVVEFVYDSTTSSYHLKLIEPEADDRIIAGVQSQIADIDGDGIVEIITPFGCQEFGPNANARTNPNTDTSCVTDQGFFVGTAFNFPDLPYSEDFHCHRSGVSDGIDCGPDDVNSQRGYRISRVKQNREQVLDLLLSARDGLNNEAYWHYAPISANPDRLTDVPLYQTPNRDLGIDYLRYGEGDHFYFTSSLYVVASFDQSNGLTDQLVCDLDLSLLYGCAVGQLSAIPLFNTNYYGYEEAIFNRQGRGFQGFRKVVSEQRVTHPSDVSEDPANDLRSVSIFHQIFPLAGELEASYTQSAITPYDPMQDRETNPQSPAVGGFKVPADIYSLNRFNYACRDQNGVEVSTCGIASGTIDSAHAEISGATSHGIYHPIMASITAEQYEPNSGLIYFRSQTDRDYDAYGNVIDEVVIESHFDTDGFTELLRHEQTQANDYTNEESNWWLGRLDRQVIRSRADYLGQPVPSGLNGQGFAAVNAPKVTTQEVFYDASRSAVCIYQFEGEQSPSGLDCQTQNRLSDLGVQTTRTLNTYDLYGNALTVQQDATALSAPRLTQMSYEPTGYFPETMTNALGHQTTTVIDPREGNPIETVDANGLLTKWTYDAFGREVESWSPLSDGVGFDDLLLGGGVQHYAPRSKTALLQGGACGTSLPDDLAYCRWVISDGSPKVWQAYDRLNRVIESRSDGFRSINRTFIGTRYNGRGQVIAETVPKYDVLSSQAIESTYDPLGRLIYKVQPSSDDSNPVRYTHYQPDGLTTTIQVTNNPTAGACEFVSSSAGLDDDLCVQRTYANNGWLLKTIDAHGFQTRFWHDGQGNTKLIADPLNNLTGATSVPLTIEKKVA